jgi:acyl carrier protein
MQKQEIIEIIERSLKDVMYQKGEGEASANLNLNGSTRLLGEGALVDSLTLVSVIVDIENKLNDVHDSPVTIADERALMQKSSPFRNIGALTEYIYRLLTDQDESDGKGKSRSD